MKIDQTTEQQNDLPDDFLNDHIMTRTGARPAKVGAMQLVRGPRHCPTITLQIEAQATLCEINWPKVGDSCHQLLGRSIQWDGSTVAPMREVQTTLCGDHSFSEPRWVGRAPCPVTLKRKAQAIHSQHCGGWAGPPSEG